MLTPRKLTIAVSGLGVVAAVGIAIIALAFLSGGEEASGTSTVVASPTPTLPPPTSTAAAAPTSQAGALVPPTPTTIGAAPKPTLTATVPAPPATATSPAPRATPTPSEPTSGGPSRPGDPSPEPSGPELPDLMVLDLSVSGGLVSALIGNVGTQPIPGGTAIQLVLRGTLESKTLPHALSPGGTFTLLLAQQHIYQSELVTAVVDPNGLIPEANEANNSTTRHLEPDTPLDLALTGLGAVGADEHLSVSVRNNSTVPAQQVTARLSIYRSGSSDPLSVTVHQIGLEPQGTMVLEPAVSAVRGLSLRVVLEVVGIVDGNPANNVLEATIP